MLPGILTHLGPEGVQHLKKMAMANQMLSGTRPLGTVGEEEDDDIPDLVQNFDSEVNIDDAVNAKGPVEVVD